MATWPCETGEHVNYTKLCRLLYDGGTLALRKVFDRIVSPASLHAELKANRSILQGIKRPAGNVLSQDQWDLLYPPGGASPKSEDFDITLLFVLLRNICGLTPPATGWDALPPPRDKSLEANLVRIKYYRNRVSAHLTNAKVTDGNFRTYWSAISTALVALGIKQDDIDKLELSEIYNLVHIDYASQIKRNCGKYHPSTRQWVLEEVEKNVKKTTTEASVVLIRAGLGMGKSIVAAKICQIYGKGIDESSVNSRTGFLGGCHFFKHNDLLTQRNDPRIMLQSIARQLCNTVPGYSGVLEKKLKTLKTQDKKISQLSCVKLCEVLFDELHAIKIPEHRKVVIVIDALDECASQLKGQFKDVLRNLGSFPSWICFVLTERADSSCTELSPAVCIEIDPSDRKNKFDLSTYFTCELEKREATDLKDQLLEISGGVFLIAYFIVVTLNESIQISIPKIVADLSRKISLVYEYYFERIKTLVKPFLDREKSKISFTRMLQVVAVDVPIPEDMFNEILCLKEDDDETKEERNIALKLLHTVFPVEHGHVTVFHETVTNWLIRKDNQHNFSVSVDDGVEVLAEASLKVLTAFRKRPKLCNQPLTLSDSEIFVFQYGIKYIIIKSQQYCFQWSLVYDLAACLHIIRKLERDITWQIDMLGPVESWRSRWLLHELPRDDVCYGHCLCTAGTVLLDDDNSPLCDKDKKELRQFLDELKLPYYLFSGPVCSELPTAFQKINKKFSSLNVFKTASGYLLCLTENKDHGNLVSSTVCMVTNNGTVGVSENFDYSHLVRGVSPDEKYLIVTSSNQIKLFDVTTLAFKSKYDCDFDGIYSFHIFGNKDKGYIAVKPECQSCRYFQIYILKDSDVQLVKTINIPSKSWIHYEEIATVSHSGRVVIVTLEFAKGDDLDHDWIMCVEDPEKWDLDDMDPNIVYEIYSVDFWVGEEHIELMNPVKYKLDRSELQIPTTLFWEYRGAISDKNKNPTAFFYAGLEKYFDFKFSEDNDYLAIFYCNSFYVFCTNNGSLVQTIEGSILNIDADMHIKIISVSQSMLIVRNMDGLLFFSLSDGKVQNVFPCNHMIYPIEEFTPKDVPSLFVIAGDKLKILDFHNL